MARTTQLTEDQVRELEEGVRRLAAEGNPLAVDLQRRLAACVTPAQRAAILAHLNDDLRQAESAIVTMMQAVAAAIDGTLGPALQRAVEQARPIIIQFYDRVWSAYRSAGMLYGEDEAGVQRWLSEQGAAAAARERDYQRRLREWSVVRFRQQLESPDAPPLLPPERDGVN